MKNLKDQKGITLVALVITIIVLLILAGVSLSLVVGDNGILTRATDAGDVQKIAGVRDQVELGVAQLAADYYEAKYVRNDSVTTIGEYVLAHYADINKTLKDGTIAVTADGSKYKVTLTVDGKEYTGHITADGKWDKAINITKKS